MTSVMGDGASSTTLGKWYVARNRPSYRILKEHLN